MRRQLLPISALLLGSAFLLFAGGINALILPVRGTAEGFSALSLGLLGTGWAIGYVLGCLFTPVLVARVGHIRSFSVMAAFAAIAILMSLLLLTPWAWIPLRGLAGFCFAGAAMIVESWLSERTEASARGRIFGIYTMVNLVASTGGQMVLTVGGDTSGFFFFVLAAIFYCVALVPTAISSTTSPRPLVSVRLNVRALWRNSPVAVFAVFMVGISNGSFSALSAVYSGEVGLALTAVALFASIPVLAGAGSQIPVGVLSDRMDRRLVLLGLAVLALATDLAFIQIAPEGRGLNLVLASLFGAAIFAMYPVIVAHANDHADANSYLQTSGGLLMVFGLGSIAGPSVAGLGMSLHGPSALFYTTAAAHVLMIGFTIWRLFQRHQVPDEEKVPFVGSLPARTMTPETAILGMKEEAIAEQDLGVASPEIRGAGQEDAATAP